MTRSQKLTLVAVAGIVASTSGCNARTDPGVAATVAAHDAVLQEIPRDFYQPGLGDLMNTLQVRHAKLWFAGAAQNWELAAFEAHEIRENLDRVARWHRGNTDIPMAPSLKAYMQNGQYAIDQSITHQDSKAFEHAFDRLTDGCNQCHQSAQHGFIVITRPKVDPVGNQRWEGN